MMKLRELESELSYVDGFEEPKVMLEQYSTSAEIASRMIYTAANTYDDIVDCSVGDFGSGPGMLSIASSFMGAYSVTGFDIDTDAIETCWVNLKKLEIENVDIVQCSVPTLTLNGSFDTVVMNPPFGTRIAGIDTVFVEKGMENASVVYSLHKSSTRDHFVRLADAKGYKIEVLAELRYELPKQFKYHKEKSKDIAVDLLRFSSVS
jgi:predicted RNA methylase